MCAYYVRVSIWVQNFISVGLPLLPLHKEQGIAEEDLNGYSLKKKFKAFRLLNLDFGLYSVTACQGIDPGFRESRVKSCALIKYVCVCTRIIKATKQ